MKIEFEFWGGSSIVLNDVVPEEAWSCVEVYDNGLGDIMSAWRDDEPWFGLCTDMREGVA